MTQSFLSPALLISTFLFTSSFILASIFSNCSTQKIIKFTINPNQEIGIRYGFKEWKYATEIVFFSKTEDYFNPKLCCFDFWPGISLVDWEFFQSQTDLKIFICIIAISLTVQRISIIQHTIDKFGIISFNFQDTQKEQTVLAKFRQKV